MRARVPSRPESAAPLQGNPRVDFRAPARHGVPLDAASRQRRALLHPEQPQALAGGGAAARHRHVEARPVVDHAHVQRIAKHVQLDDDVPGARVLAGVVERFLRDAEAGDLGRPVKARLRHIVAELHVASR